MVATFTRPNGKQIKENPDDEDDSFFDEVDEAIKHADRTKTDKNDVTKTLKFFDSGGHKLGTLHFDGGASARLGEKHATDFQVLATTQTMSLWWETPDGAISHRVDGLNPITESAFNALFLNFDPLFYQHFVELSNGGANGIGAKFGDTFDFGSGPNIIDSFAGNDRVNKIASGKIIFDAGTGNDTLSFQAADGQAFPNPFTQQFVIDLGTGIGTNPYGGTLKLTSVENIIGTSAGDKITGNNSANRIGDGVFDAGADIIDAKSGDDTVFIGDFALAKAKGGSGDDEIVFGSGSNAIGVNVDLQDDAFKTRYSGFEIWRLSPSSVQNGLQPNTLRGDAQDNYFVGHDGEDTFQGRGGNDLLFGGGNLKPDFITTGKDVAVFSGNKADYSFKVLGSTVVVTDKRPGSTDGHDGVSGIETLRFANGDIATSTLLANPGKVYLGNYENEFPDGGSVNDSLFGMGGNDHLNGRAGADLLVGGKGNDTYADVELADIIREENGQGNDTVETRLVSYSIAKLANIENLTGLNFLGQTLTGNALNNVITGFNGKDTLNGGAGNDRLKGSFGADKLNGGAGSDTADFSEKLLSVVATLKGATASIVKVGGVNEDTVRNIENLVGGSKADTFTGDGQSNVLTGLGGHDVLAGKGGNDKFVYTSFKHGGDKITDFAHGDKFVFEGSVFGLGTYHGTLAKADFVSNIKGHATTHTGDTFVFDQSNDTLWYDANGKTSGGDSMMADLNNIGLKYTDILIT